MFRFSQNLKSVPRPAGFFKVKKASKNNKASFVAKMSFDEIHFEPNQRRPKARLSLERRKNEKFENRVRFSKAKK